jgi:ABC-type glutathione transport system ATPase component
MTLLSVRDLTLALGATGAPLVDKVSLDVSPGEIVGIVGESGSGKTLLARVAQGRAGAAHKGMTYAAKTMAATAVEALTDEALLARTKEAHAAFRAKNPFVNTIGSEVPPALDMAAH